MKAKVTIELEIDLSDEAIYAYSDDPSPSGVALPSGKEHYIELAPDCPEPAYKIFEELYDLLNEHAFNHGDESPYDPEEFLQDLYKRHNLKIDLQP